MKSIKIDYFVSLSNKAINVFKVFIIPDSHILWFEAFLMNGQFKRRAFRRKLQGFPLLNCVTLTRSKYKT